MDTLAQSLLDFWFGPPDSEAYGKPQKFWFLKDPAFDAELEQRFLPLYHQACQGQVNHWRATTLGCLALILAFDQLPRNFFRESPQAFATDTQALAIAQALVNTQQDQTLLNVQRWFVYLPFEHSENLEHQNQAVALYEQLRDDAESASSIDYAYRHQRIIQRFGRFPHRNAILGRPSTETELEFLQQPGSRF
ncbi:MAG: DUF924 family protein [Cyanobacteria bacterium P01_H01_bin.121]